MAGDSRIPALTEISLPDLLDVYHIVDVSDPTEDASGTSRKISLTRLLGLMKQPCMGRLTTESGVPVSGANRSAQSTIYFTPYDGNMVTLYDGTRWRMYQFSEVSFVLTSLTSGKNYDVFLYDNSGTLTIELSAAWATDTSRTDALALQDGVNVKSGATTRRWIGTIRTTGTTTTEDSDTKRFVWNKYNQVDRALSKVMAGGGHDYAVNTTRFWNADSTNIIEWVQGEASEKTNCTWGSNQRNSTTALSAITSVQIDSGTTETLLLVAGPAGTTNTGRHIATGTAIFGTLSIGYHFFALTERCGAGTCQFESAILQAEFRG